MISFEECHSNKTLKFLNLSKGMRAGVKYTLDSRSFRKDLNKNFNILYLYLTGCNEKKEDICFHPKIFLDVDFTKNECFLFIMLSLEHDIFVLKPKSTLVSVEKSVNKFFVCKNYFSHVTCYQRIKKEFQVLKKNVNSSLESEVDSQECFLYIIHGYPWSFPVKKRSVCFYRVN